MLGTGVRKTLWWGVLAVGAGGLAIFISLVIEIGPPGWEFWWLIPILSLTALLLSLWRLKRLYGRKSIRELGPWQFRIADLVGAVLWFGALLCIWQAYLNQYLFLAFGITFSLLAGMLYLVGSFVGLRRGYLGSATRAAFSSGFVLFALGSIVVGGFLAFQLFGLFMWILPIKSIELGDPMKVIFRRELPSHGLLCSAVFSLPVGLMIMLYMKRFLPSALRESEWTSEQPERQTSGPP